MLENVLEYLNNFFINSRYSVIDIETDGVTGVFDTDDFIATQYVSIDGTKVNDGVYKILSVTSTKLTLDATMIAETPKNCILWGLAVPKIVVDLTAEISTYDGASTKGIKSESQGNRSVSYGTSLSGGSSDWQSVFGSSLAPYRQLYSDKLSWGLTSDRWC